MQGHPIIKVIQMKGRLIIFLFIAMAFSSCYYDVEEELYPQRNNCDTTAVTYATKIAPIISQNCALSGCHVAGAQQPDLSDYNKLNANLPRVNERAVISKTMPPTGPLDKCDVEALETWISSGAPNN